MVAQSESMTRSQLAVVATEKPVAKRKRRPRIRLGPSGWVYIGVTIAAGGLGAIGYAWVRVAGLGNVALQVPYLISAGLIGVAVTAIGVAIAHFASTHIDATQRRRDLERQADILEAIAIELRAFIDDQEKQR